MKVYNVFHRYHIDGGFGDAISRNDLIATFESKEDAEAFANEFSNPHVYDSPDLFCGNLYVEEKEIISHKEFDMYSVDGRYWWLPNPRDVEITECESEIIGYCMEQGCTRYEALCCFDEACQYTRCICHEVYDKWKDAHDIDPVTAWRYRHER